MDADLRNRFEQAAEAIEGSAAVLVSAGAGMGVDSGLPDFRGSEGFWKAYPAFRERNLSFVDMANPAWFAKDPRQAWGFYGHRQQLYRQTRPHDGFQLLRDWATSKPEGYFVFTSNVDGHFQKAGFSEPRVLECHGALEVLQCTERCHHDLWSAAGIDVEIDEETFRAQPPLPQCRRCRGVARPNILMFGDWCWLDQRTREQERRYDEWLTGIDPASLVVIECGAGTAVPTVRYESERVGGQLIRINPREPDTPPGGISIPCGALQALTHLDSLLS